MAGFPFSRVNALLVLSAVNLSTASSHISFLGLPSIAGGFPVVIRSVRPLNVNNKSFFSGENKL